MPFFLLFAVSEEKERGKEERAEAALVADALQPAARPPPPNPSKNVTIIVS